MSQQEKKILRIGIIQGGKIVEERLLRKREPVTVGEDVKNTFSIPNVGLPGQFPLFLLKGDNYYLTMAEWMDGRISLGSGVNSIHNLQEQGVAKKVGQVDYAPPENPKKKVSVFQIPLNDKSRGKLTMGDVTLLFQFVTPPPLPAKTQLPAIMQGGWVDGIPWIYASILLSSLFIHLALIFTLFKIGPIPEGAGTFENVSARFRDLIVPPPKKVEPPVKKDKDETGKDKKGKDKKNKKKAQKTPKKKIEVKPRKKLSAGDVAKRKAANKARIAKRLQGAGLLNALIGAKGGDGSTITDVVGGNVISDVSSATKDLKSGLGIATGNPGAGRRRGGGGGGAINVGTGLDSGPDGGNSVGGGGRVSKKIRSSLKLRKIEQEDGGSLDAGKLGRMIQRKMRVVQYCYNIELKKNPGLKGKISFRIVIRNTGRVKSIETEDNELNATVASCIKRKIFSWKFPKPKDGAESSTIVVPFLFNN